MFEVGDEVYSKRFGEGVVTDVDDNDLYIYPIHVQWKNSCKRSIFTPEGKYNIHFNDPDVDICLLKVGKFKVGDHVYSKHFGEGVVEHIDDPKTNTYPVQVYWIGAVPRSFNSCEFYTPDGVFNKLYPQPDNDIIKKKDAKFKVGDRVFAPFHKYGTIVTVLDTGDPYPITVRWDESRYKIGEDCSTFTEDGYVFAGDKTDNTKITKVGEEEMGQIASVIDHNIEKTHDSKEMVEDKKFMETRRKNDEEREKFKVGDYVYSQFAGVGEIIKIGANENLEYPIQVKWCNQKPTSTFAYDFFTRDGRFYSDRKNMIKDIVPVEELDMEFKEKNDGTVERMEDALNKKVEDAVNPAHYKVKGLPEAIDIMNHLMQRCQLEGYLWGNIIKYAYRYGRKGDKAETAGKIEWYARQLKALEECESEEREKNEEDDTETTH